MKKKKNGIALIKKSNDLIDAKYKFSIWEMRIFISILAQIHKDDQDFMPYRIWYKDVIKNFGLKSAEAYNYLREAGNSLLDKKLYTNYLNEGIKRDVTYNIFGKVDTLSQEAQNVMTNFDKQGFIEITVHPDMKPFLLQLQKNFTAYDLKNVIKLGVYPIRIYELLKQYESIGHRKLGVDEIKDMFELTTEYPLFANFYQRIIEPAIKEINEFTDIFVDNVEKLKDGKRVVALHFYFRKKTTKEIGRARKNSGVIEPPNLFTPPNIAIEIPVFENEIKEAIEPYIVENNNTKDELFLEYNEIVVKKFGVSPSVFFAALEKYDKEAIDRAIRVTERMQKEGKAKNVSGFFIEALRNNYTDQEEQKTLRQKERAESEQQKRLLKADLEEDLEHLELQIKQKENATIREIVTNDENAREKAIEKAKVLILKNPFYKNAIAKKGYDLETLDIQTWREDELLRELVKEGFKISFQPEFEYLVEMRIEKNRLELKIKELTKVK
jgi:plasmid replication initiation protein